MEVPVEAIALLALFRDIFDIAASAQRASMLGWVVTLAAIVGFVLILWAWAAYSLKLLILFYHWLGTVLDRLRALLDVARSRRLVRDNGRQVLARIMLDELDHCRPSLLRPADMKNLPRPRRWSSVRAAHFVNSLIGHEAEEKHAASRHECWIYCCRQQVSYRDTEFVRGPQPCNP